MGRGGEGETRRWGDAEMGGWGDGETRRWGDGEMGRRGDTETRRGGGKINYSFGLSMNHEL
ncbi:MAG: hypothetical protein F6K58_30845 [Symploca sp. SIO2E9]|nr:hypothetical protein [Symploca sp. SIO2E9]